MRPHIRLEHNTSHGLGVIEHGDRVSDGERQGLLAQHMLSRIQCAMRPLCMEVIRQRVVHRVNISAREHRIVRGAGITGATRLRDNRLP